MNRSNNHFFRRRKLDFIPIKHTFDEIYIIIEFEIYITNIIDFSGLELPLLTIPNYIVFNYISCSDINSSLSFVLSIASTNS